MALTQLGTALVNSALFREEHRSSQLNPHQVQITYPCTATLTEGKGGTRGTSCLDQAGVTMHGCHSDSPRTAPTISSSAPAFTSAASSGETLEVCLGKNHVWAMNVGTTAEPMTTVNRVADSPGLISLCVSPESAVMLPKVSPVDVTIVV